MFNSFMHQVIDKMRRYLIYTKDGINNISQQFPDIQSTNARWTTEDGFKKYYFGDGQMATGWHLIDGNKYFLQWEKVTCNKING